MSLLAIVFFTLPFSGWPGATRQRPRTAPARARQLRPSFELTGRLAGVAEACDTDFHQALTDIGAFVLCPGTGGRGPAYRLLAPVYRFRTLTQGPYLEVWPDRLVTAQIETMALRVLYLVAIRGNRLANIARPRAGVQECGDHGAPSRGHSVAAPDPSPVKRASRPSRTGVSSGALSVASA